MEVSKDRLLEIENELNSMTILDMVQRENLSLAPRLPRTKAQLKASSNNIKNYMNSERFIESSIKGGHVGAEVNRKNNTGMWGITYEQRSTQSKKNQDFYTTCPHCGRTEKGSFFVIKHIPNCVLQHISLEDFVQEWKNPTMTRGKFAEKIGIGVPLLMKFKNDLIMRGLL